MDDDEEALDIDDIGEDIGVGAGGSHGLLLASPYDDPFSGGTMLAAATMSAGGAGGAAAAAPGRLGGSSVTSSSVDLSSWIIDSKWTAGGDMDPESRALIEQMLQEEVYYNQRKPLPPATSTAASGDAPLSTPKDSTVQTMGAVSTAVVVASAASSPKSGRGIARAGLPPSKRSSASLPSHNTRWTNEEEALFMTGLKRKGHGNWKAISELIGSRNPLQVKNHARQLVESRKLTVTASELGKGRKRASVNASPGTRRGDNASDSEDASPLTGNLNGQDDFEGDEDSDLDIGGSDKDDHHDDFVGEALTIAESLSDSETTKREGADMDAVSDVDEKVEEELVVDPLDGSSAAAEPEQEKQTVSEAALTLEPTTIPAHGPALEHVVAVAKEDATASSSSSAAALAPVAPHNDEDDEMEDIPERDIDLEDITDEEKQGNPDFFQGSSSKTPDRYMRIRNHLVKIWLASKPKPISKTKSRVGLKDCGDVNVIGKVFDFLEQSGFINAGTENSKKRRRRISLPKVEKPASDTEDPVFAAFEYDFSDGFRKRPKRAVAVSTRTIAHMTQEEMDEAMEQQRLEALNARYFDQSEIVDSHDVPATKRASYYIKNQQRYHRGGTAGDDDLVDDGSLPYDPFRLVVPQRFNAINPAPFQVIIRSNCLLMMDFHAHLVHTEVIGLLGGRYDPEARQLWVETVFPCNSLSTGIQCEMDPVSETAARDAFSQSGYIPVGWYHSHPTFAPNPSIRDIENQTAYQLLFRTEGGLEPFIGVIVSPYDQRYPSNVSHFQVLSVVENLADPTSQLRSPVQCERLIYQDDVLSDELFNALASVYVKYVDYEKRVNLNAAYRKGEALTRGEKLLESLKANMSATEPARSEFIARLRLLFLP